MSIATIVCRQRDLALTLTILIAAMTSVAQDVASGSPPLIIQPGTVLTVRLNEPLSSDRNQVGDIFSASLVQPIVVHGIVVSQRGQTVAGRVVETRKAGTVSGVSRLGIALTSLTLVDGQNVPVHSQLVMHKGATSPERDAAAVAGTTGLGAAIGGVADWGEGAAIGAGVGAVAGTIGVLLTRGHSTVIYPETLLTFELTAPVTIHTDNAPGAFHAVNPEDYQAGGMEREGSSYPPVAVAPTYPYPYPMYYGLPYYPYYVYPFAYGPSFRVFFGYPRYNIYHYSYPHFYGYRHYPYPRYWGHGFIPKSGPYHHGTRPGYHGHGGRHR